MERLVVVRLLAAAVAVARRLALVVVSLAAAVVAAEVILLAVLSVYRLKGQLAVEIMTIYQAWLLVVVLDLMAVIAVLTGVLAGILEPGPYRRQVNRPMSRGLP
jgi:hypothetical protein